MNQILKRLYGLGTQKQVDFMAEIGGMNEEEKRLFQLLHERKDDQYIMDDLNLNRRSFGMVQESVRAKLIIAVFYCINKAIGM